MYHHLNEPTRWLKIRAVVLVRWIIKSGVLSPCAFVLVCWRFCLSIYSYFFVFLSLVKLIIKSNVSSLYSSAFVCWSVCMSVSFVYNFACLCLFIFLLLVGWMNHQIWRSKSLRLCSLQVIVISLVAHLQRKSIKESKTFYWIITSGFCSCIRTGQILSEVPSLLRCINLLFFLVATFNGSNQLPGFIGRHF